jgi:hypothetical protein
LVRRVHATLAKDDERSDHTVIDDEPLRHQLHDLSHQLLDEVEIANEHVGHAYDAILDFVERVGEHQPAWADILLQQAGKLQAAAMILSTTADEVHSPETWNIPAFGDETNMAQA